MSYLKGNPRGATKTGLVVSIRKNRLVWRPDPIHMTAFEIDHALQKQALDAKLHGKTTQDGSNVHKAKDFISKYLEKGPAWVSVVLDQAEVVQIKETTFRKALRRLTEDDGKVERFTGEDGRQWIRFPIPQITQTTMFDGDESPAPPVSACDPEPVRLDAWNDDGGAISGD